MIDTSMYGRIGGFDQGLRMGQAIGGVFTTARNANLREQALERIKAGEDYSAVVQEVMQQSPEIAQELVNLRQANLTAKQNQQALTQGEQTIEVDGMKLQMAKLQQSAMPLMGALMVDDEKARRNLLAEAAEPFKTSNPEVANTIMQIADLAPEQQAGAIGGIVKMLRQAGVYPDDPSRLAGQGTALGQNLALLDQARQSGDKEREQLILRNMDPQERAMAQGGARVTTEQQLNPVLAERTGQQEQAKLREQQTVKSEEKAKQNDAAFSAYQQAASAVGKLSNQAGSGVFGLAPAVFADDRLFEGAIAILRPAIKDVVRGAGEGTFTDADQRVMDQMLPSRFDSPEVRMMKLQMLDNYIRAKLGQPQLEQSGQSQQPFLPQQQTQQQGVRQIGRFTVQEVGGN